MSLLPKPDAATWRPSPQGHDVLGQTVKTDRRGWYLNRRRSLAIGDDGLPAAGLPAGTPARFTASRSPRSCLPMVAANGKDGEGGALTCSALAAQAVRL